METSIGTLSDRNAPDVIEQISTIKFFMFFASDFKLCPVPQPVLPLGCEIVPYNGGNETKETQESSIYALLLDLIMWFPIVISQMTLLKKEGQMERSPTGA